jgi:hypothetical protein
MNDPFSHDAKVCFGQMDHSVEIGNGFCSYEKA